MKVKEEKISFVRSLDKICDKFIASIESTKVNLLIDFLQADKLAQKEQLFVTSSAELKGK